LKREDLAMWEMISKEVLSEALHCRHIYSHTVIVFKIEQNPIPSKRSGFLQSFILCVILA
jgi:hypothetical protein